MQINNFIKRNQVLEKLLNCCSCTGTWFWFPPAFTQQLTRLIMPVLGYPMHSSNLMSARHIHDAHTYMQEKIDLK